MRYVLDANIAIAALNGVEAVQRRLADVPATEIGIPVAAIAELTFGAYKSKRTEANLARIAMLKRSVAILPVSDRVVDLYGSKRAALESRGVVKREVMLPDIERVVLEAVDRVSNDLRELRAQTEKRKAQFKVIEQRLDA